MILALALDDRLREEVEKKGILSEN